MKPPLVMLHGALADSSQFTLLKAELAEKFDCYCPDFPGHLKDDSYQGSIRVEQLSAFVLDYIDEQQLERPHFLGYSLGGYVALALAKTQPQRVGSIYSLATHFFWTDEFAAKAVAQLDADKMELKVPAFADGLKQRFGASYWRVLLNNTADMMTHLGSADLLAEALKDIEQPTMIAVGELDKLVDVERSKRAALLLANGQFKQLPGGKHLFEQLDITQVKTELEDFLL